MYKQILQVYDDKGVPDSGRILIAPTEDCLKMMSSDFKNSLQAGYSMCEVQSEDQIQSKVIPTEEGV